MSAAVFDAVDAARVDSDVPTLSPSSPVEAEGPTAAQPQEETVDPGLVVASSSLAGVAGQGGGDLAGEELAPTEETRAESSVGDSSVTDVGDTTTTTATSLGQGRGSNEHASGSPVKDGSGSDGRVVVGEALALSVGAGDEISAEGGLPLSSNLEHALSTSISEPDTSLAEADEGSAAPGAEGTSLLADSTSPARENATYDPPTEVVSTDVSSVLPPSPPPAMSASPPRATASPEVKHSPTHTATHVSPLKTGVREAPIRARDRSDTRGSSLSYQSISSHAHMDPDQASLNDVESHSLASVMWRSSMLNAPSLTESTTVHDVDLDDSEASFHGARDSRDAARRSRRNVVTMQIDTGMIAMLGGGAGESAGLSDGDEEIKTAVCTVPPVLGGGGNERSASPGERREGRDDGETRKNEELGDESHEPPTGLHFLPQRRQRQRTTSHPDTDNSPTPRPMAPDDGVIRTNFIRLQQESSLAENHDDWQFWGEVMSDYTFVARTQGARLAQAIQTGIPPALRGLVWQLMSASKDQELEQLYAELLKKPSIHEKAIGRDINRTFPTHDYFRDAAGIGQESLFNVVKAYSLYDPEVGYTQGLQFVTGPLLLNMPDEEAFCLLVRLMHSYDLRSHYTPDMPGLQVRLFQFDRLLEDLIPDVFLHLLKQGIKSSMYASQWFLTLFGYRFPLELVCSVLDLVLAEGVEAIFRFAIAIMKRSQDIIMSLKFEQLADFLKNGLFEPYAPSDGEGGLYNASEFVKEAIAVKISPLVLDQYADEWEALRKQQMAQTNEIASLRKANAKLSTQVRSLESSLSQLNGEHCDLVKELVMGKIAREELEEELVRYKMAFADLSLKQAAEGAQQSPNVSRTSIDLDEYLAAPSLSRENSSEKSMSSSFLSNFKMPSGTSPGGNIGSFMSGGFLNASNANGTGASASGDSLATSFSKRLFQNS